jgi:hypothetical protein
VRARRVQRRLACGVERICFDRHPAARYRLPVDVTLGGSGDARPGRCLAPPGHFISCPLAAPGDPRPGAFQLSASAQTLNAATKPQSAGWLTPNTGSVRALSERRQAPCKRAKPPRRGRGVSMPTSTHLRAESRPSRVGCLTSCQGTKQGSIPPNVGHHCGKRQNREQRIA